MNIPSVRLVFDRKHVATKQKKGLVQLEITYKGKRKWLSADVKVYKDQWNDRKYIINSTDSIDANDYLNKLVSDMEKWLRDNQPFSWEKLDRHLKEGMKSDNFLDWLADELADRHDIRDTTKVTQRKLLSILKEYGKIEYFKDLTSPAIFDFDNWLHARKIKKLDRNGLKKMEFMRQQTIFTYHKLLRTYINRAINRGLMTKNPYDGYHFPKGESEEGRYLKEDEFRKLMNAPMRSGSVARARDVFVFQSYTGMAFVDLVLFDYNKVEDENGCKVYHSKREKTGERFVFLLLPKALEILQKYDYKLPLTSMEAYNRNLKKAAEDAGIDKPVSTHWARRTAAVLLANHKVPYEIIAKILGHADIKTTAKFYARLNDDTIIDAMKKAGL